MKILEAHSISKSFFGVPALDNISFDIREGEILTVLGENGAGKSTLMSVLIGIYRMDRGEIIIDGAPKTFSSPNDSLKYGIGMVHQHFMLVEAHSVFENILVSLSNLPFILKIKSLKIEIKNFIAKFNLSFDIDTPIYKLSVGEQQWVEIIKLLIMECRVMILDEPTAVLTPQESARLFVFLKQLREMGKSIIFISHKMKEVMDLSDRVMILKKGRLVGIRTRGEFTEADLAQLMLGEDRVPVWEKKPQVSQELILNVKDLTVIGDRGIKGLDGLSLSLYKGEILGVVGIAGNGQKDLAETLTGLKDSSGGKIYAEGHDITNSTARRSYIAGIAHIPEDRKSMGTAPDLSVEENLIMKNFHQKRFRSLGILQKQSAIREYAKSKINIFAIKVGPPNAPIKLMSGGNIQKVIIARELSGTPMVLVALYPTRGLDIGSAEYVHKVMADSAKNGMSILLISEDLDELFKMSDRLVVMFRGKIMGEVSPSTTTREEIGLMMSGENV